MTRKPIGSIARAKLLAAVVLVALPAAHKAWAQAGAATIFACPIASVTTGGAPVKAIPGKVNGAVITNPNTATEALFVDQTKAATTSVSATNFSIAAGQSYWVVPNAVGPAGSAPPGVSVNAATNGHAFNCIMW